LFRVLVVVQNGQYKKYLGSKTGTSVPKYLTLGSKQMSTATENGIGLIKLENLQYIDQLIKHGVDLILC